LQNLATADLLFIVTCIPPTAIDYAVGWPLDDLWCKIVQYLINVTTYGSVYTLVLLSLDRYLVKLLEFTAYMRAWSKIYKISRDLIHFHNKNILLGFANI
jgi:hypothetical protein